MHVPWTCTHVGSRASHLELTLAQVVFGKRAVGTRACVQSLVCSPENLRDLRLHSAPRPLQPLKYLNADDTEKTWLPIVDVSIYGIQHALMAQSGRINQGNVSAASCDAEASLNHRASFSVLSVYVVAWTMSIYDQPEEKS